MRNKRMFVTLLAYRRAIIGGRYRTRTDDLFRVKEARYQLRQSPAMAILPQAEVPERTLTSIVARPVTRHERAVWPQLERWARVWEHSGNGVHNADVAQW